MKRRYGEGVLLRKGKNPLTCHPFQRRGGAQSFRLLEARAFPCLNSIHAVEGHYFCAKSAVEEGPAPVPSPTWTPPQPSFIPSSNLSIS